MDYRLKDNAGASPLSIDELRQKASAGELGPDTVLVDANGVECRLGDLLARAQAPLPTALGPAKAKKPSPVLIIVVVALAVCFCLPVGAALLFPVFSRAKHAAVQTDVVSEMKVLATGLVMYSAAHGDKLPPDMSTGTAILQAVSEHVPEEPFERLNNGTLEGNHELSGKSVDGVERPQLKILVYYSDNALGPYVVVMFADFHVAKVPAMDFLEARNNNTYEMRR